MDDAIDRWEAWARSVLAARWAPMVVIALCGVLFFLGNGAHGLWDEDEPRYAQATREMLETRDFVTPRFNTELRAHKPILIYWLMCVPMSMMGTGEFAARTVAATSGVITLVVLWRLARSLGCSASGQTATLGTAGLSLMFLLISKAAIIDGALQTTIVACLALAWNQWRHGFRWWRLLALWAMMAAAILLKGPPGPIVVGMGVLGFLAWNRWRPTEDAPAGGQSVFDFALSQLLGLLVCLALCAPWAALVHMQSGGRFFEEALGTHVRDRALKAINSQGGSVFYYLIVIPIALAPFTVWGLRALGDGLGHLRQGADRFLVCWLALPLIVFSLVQTKLPHYAAPLLPAVALMVGRWITRLEGAGWRAEGAGTTWAAWGRRLTWLAGAAPPLLLALGMIAAPAVLRLLPRPGEVPLLLIIGGPVAGLLLAATLASGWWLLIRGQIATSLVAVAAGWATTLAVALTLVLPALDTMRPSRAITGWIKEHAPANVTYMASDYRASSLIYNWGSPIIRISNADPDKAAAMLAQPPVAMSITQGRWDEWRQKDAQRPAWAFPPEATERTRLHLFHFEKGRWEDFLIIGNW